MTIDMIEPPINHRPGQRSPLDQHRRFDRRERRARSSLRRAITGSTSATLHDGLREGIGRTEDATDVTVPELTDALRRRLARMKRVL